MALQKQVVPIEIATGIDTKTDPKKVTGKLISLINAIFKESKALLKRNGFLGKPQTILGGSSIASGATISPYQNELVELDGKNLYSFSDQQAAWVNKGSLPVSTISTVSIVKNSRGQTTQDQAQHPSGFQVFTWEDTAGGTYYSVIDTGTGQTLVNSSLLSATGYVAKPIAIGNYVVIFYYDTSVTSLRYQAINMSTPTTIGSAVTIAGSPNLFNVPANSCIYDAALIGSYIHIGFAFTTGIAFYTLSSSLALANPATIAVTNVNNIAVFGDASNNAWVAYCVTVDSIYVAEYTNQFAAQTLAPTAIDGTASYTSLRNLTGIVIGTTAHVFYESDQYNKFILGTLDVFYGDFIRSNTITSAGAVGTAYNVIRSLGIASKPFIYNGIIYMLGVYDATRTSKQPGLVYDPSTESTYFLIDFNGNISDKVAQLNGGGISKKFIAPEALTITASSFQMSYLFKDLLVAESGSVYTQTGVQAVMISFTGVYPTKLEIGRALLLGGGCVYQYDGSIPTELNFHLYPELMTAWVGQVGGAVGIGSFEYKSIYDWTDNQGQNNKSGTSDPLIVKQELLTINVLETSGSNVLIMNPGLSGYDYYSYQNLDVGFLITGTNVPAGTIVTQRNQTATIPIQNQIILSNTVTGSSAEANLIVTPQVFVTGTTVDLFDTVVIDPMEYIPYSVNLGKNGLLYGSDLSFLQVGMYMTYIAGGSGVPGGYITAIDPVSRIITGPFGLVPSTGPSVVRVYKNFTGTYTNGSNVITSVTPQIFQFLSPNDLIKVGSALYKINSFNAGASTINLSTTYTGTSVVQDAHVFFPAASFLKPGQVITGAGLPANTVIKSIAVQPYISAGGQPTNITTSNKATTSGTGTSFTLTGLYCANLTMPTIRATNKTNVSLVLYRSLANGTQLYRTTPISSPVINSKTEDLAYLYDAISDYNLAGNEELYTNGGEVDNTSPPATQTITTYKNRAILVPNENQLSWWYSKQVIPGAPVEFSDNFVQNIDSRGGVITAVAAMDDKLVLFKENNIFYVVGEGPTPAGTQNDFSEPQLTSTDTGCNNPASVVLTPDGLMFQSTQGIYLLTRGMNVLYVGADVEAYNTDTVTSAVLEDNVNQVRFSMASGVVLVYDYYFKQWSIFTNIAAVDACVYQGIYHYLKSNGLVNAETPGTYNDNGAFIQMSLTTSWMSFAGLQGFQRIWRLIILGQYKSPHTLLVNVGTDFAPTFEQNVTIPVATDPVLYQYRIHMKQQKCESMQFQIQDSQTSPIGEGLQLSEISLEVGLKVGVNKLSAGKSY